MCMGCWHEYGAPALVGDRITQAVALIERIYYGDYVQGAWRRGNLAGGNLHNQLDDWNLDDEHFAGEYDERVYYEHAPHRMALERACYDLLKSMTVAERASALAWYDGFIADSLPGAPPQPAHLAKQ